MTRQNKNFKTVSIHSEYTDLILKIIKKDKISRLRVPLSFQVPRQELVERPQRKTRATYKRRTTERGTEPEYQ